SRSLVGSVGGYGVAGPQVEVDVLAGICPESGKPLGSHLAALDVSVVDVRDLQLVPSGGLKRSDNVEDVLVVEVDPGDSPIAAERLGLLDDSQHPAILLRQLRHAIGAGILHLRQQDLGTTALVTELAAD